MQQHQSFQDILTRNNHRNPFHIKIPSHNAKQQNVQHMCQAYILNKLSLIPFQHHPQLPQLFRVSLQNLIQLVHSNATNAEFVMQFVEHLQRWETNMGHFGTWLYTRAAFYSIQDYLKTNPELMEKVIVRRAMLQPNQQIFYDRAKNIASKNQQLIKILDICEKKDMEEEQSPKHEALILPRDILLLDTDECWTQLHQTYQQLDKLSVKDYLLQYSRGNSVLRFIRLQRSNRQLQQMKESLLLRKRVYKQIMGEQINKIGQILEQIEGREQKVGSKD